ncbi:MAG: ribulose-phosphate 3-epimerase [Oscillospiraceae bacterium]
MIIVSPSILSCDFAKLGAECEDVKKGGAEWLHFDVMDGVFVDNITFGAPVLKSLAKSLDMFFDVHLMIVDPLKFVGDFAEAGADMITFHLESVYDVSHVIESIRAKGVKAGIALRPKTPAEAVFPYLSQIDMVLAMTVEPGFGGQRFKEETCSKISKIRAEADRLGKRDFDIQVDGGIAGDTARQCAAAGANVFVAGSSVFGKPDRASAISEILESAREAFRK